MTRHSRPFAPALLLAVVWGNALPALAQAATPPTRTGEEISASATQTPRLISAPDFSLESVSGETVSLTSFRGKVVVLNFWATWCAPCKILTPWLVELQNQYGPQGLQIVGVALDDDATKVEIGEAADTLRVNFPVLIGNEKVASAYGGVPAMPVTFFIGRDGKMIGAIVGLKGKGEIEDLIKKALGVEAASGSLPAAPDAAAKAQK